MMGARWNGEEVVPLFFVFFVVFWGGSLMQGWVDER